MMNIKSEQFAFALSSPLSLPRGMAFMLGNVTDIEVQSDFRDTIKLVLPENICKVTEGGTDHETYDDVPYSIEAEIKIFY